jgi:hypothetical protein
MPSLTICTVESARTRRRKSPLRRRRKMTGPSGSSGGEMLSTSPASMPWMRTRVPTSTPRISRKPTRTCRASLPNQPRLPTANRPTPARPRPSSTTAPRMSACRRDSDRDTTGPPQIGRGRRKRNGPPLRHYIRQSRFSGDATPGPEPRLAKLFHNGRNVLCMSPHLWHMMRGSLSVSILSGPEAPVIRLCERGLHGRVYQFQAAMPQL